MPRESQPLYPESTVPYKECMGMDSSAPPMQMQPVQQSPPLVLLGPDNTITVCPFCHASIKTAVRYSTTSRTHMAAALCSLVCCCCCIPYCSESAKNSDHYCPNCQKYLGTYEK